MAKTLIKKSISKITTPQYNLRSIDLLKGVAILMIIIVHSVQVLPILPSLNDAAHLGQMGVQLFFLVSGFTLALSWLNNKKPKNVNFYKKRLLAIAPAYYLMFTVFIVSNFALINIFNASSIFKPNHDLPCVLVNILFLNGVVPDCNNNAIPGSWYIGTIMVLYLMFPSLIKIFGMLYKTDKRLAHSMPYVALLLSILTQYIITLVYGTPSLSENSSFLYFSFVNQLPCFLLGISLLYAWKEGETQKVSINAALANFVTSAIICSVLFYSNIPLVFTIIPMVGAISFYWLFILIDNSARLNPDGTKPSSEFIYKWAKVSYSAYLVHGLFVWYFQEFVVKILHMSSIEYNPTLLYLLLIVPMFTLTYFAAKYLNKIVAALTKRIIDPNILELRHSWLNRRVKTKTPVIEKT